MKKKEFSLNQTEISKSIERIEITQFSSDEKRIYVLNNKGIFINHPVLKMIYDQFEYLIKVGRTNGSRGVIVIGHSGCGKTTICKRIQSKYYQVHNDEKEIFPVIFANCPTTPTFKGVLSKLLEAFHAPGFDIGTRTEMEARIKHYIRKCLTRLIIFDEVQELINHGDNKTVTREGIDTINFLKNISNETDANIALVGTEEAKYIYSLNFQIQRRFREVYRLPLFKRDKTFQCLLKEIETRLLLKKESKLYESKMAHHIWELTRGIISEVMLLLREAAQKAIENGDERITEDLLVKCKDKIVRITNDKYAELLHQKAYEVYE